MSPIASDGERPARNKMPPAGEITMLALWVGGATILVAAAARVSSRRSVKGASHVPAAERDSPSEREAAQRSASVVDGRSTAILIRRSPVWVHALRSQSVCLAVPTTGFFAFIVNPFILEL